LNLTWFIHFNFLRHTQISLNTIINFNVQCRVIKVVHFCLQIFRERLPSYSKRHVSHPISIWNILNQHTHIDTRTHTHTQTRLSLFPRLYIPLRPVPYAGAGGPDQLQPRSGGERGDGLWKDHPGHPVHPGRLHHPRSGLALQGGVHPAATNQCHLRTYSTHTFSNAYILSTYIHTLFSYSILSATEYSRRLLHSLYYILTLYCIHTCFTTYSLLLPLNTLFYDIFSITYLLSTTYFLLGIHSLLPNHSLLHTYPLLLAYSAA
jgi:hypothetical protein